MRALRPALIQPLIDALVVGDDHRRLVLVLGGHVTKEHVRWLHHVVVDAHQDQVVGVRFAPRVRDCITQVIPSSGVTVSALSGRGLAESANVGRPVIELRRGGRALAVDVDLQQGGLSKGVVPQPVSDVDDATRRTPELSKVLRHKMFENQSRQRPGSRAVSTRSSRSPASSPIRRTSSSSGMYPSRISQPRIKKRSSISWNGCSTPLVWSSAPLIPRSFWVRLVQG